MIANTSNAKSKANSQQIVAQTLHVDVALLHQVARYISSTQKGTLSNIIVRTRLCY